MVRYHIGQSDQRPWGTWEIIAVGRDYVVKRIVVTSGQRLSLQRHLFRAEHWVVVNGQGMVTNGDALTLISPGQNAVIGCGAIHRIENIGQDDLVFIEVQHGEHLDENDIERISDDYGRS